MNATLTRLFSAGAQEDSSASYVGYAACSGCSLCLLACPVWHHTHDIRLTPHGRAKALQHGASVHELMPSIDSCTLCGACEPACPEEIDLIDMLLGLRVQLNSDASARTASVEAEMALRVRQNQVSVQTSTNSTIQIVLDSASYAGTAANKQLLELFGGEGKVAVARDDGADIVLALEIGATIPETRRTQLLASLRDTKRIIIGDGLLLRAVKKWLPQHSVQSLGEALSGLAAVRKSLLASDLYIIEARAYHADRERLVKYYDGLRQSSGCSMNLDLQRLAIPTTVNSFPQILGHGAFDSIEQAKWILEGRDFARIIVEDIHDIDVFRHVTNKPVLHLAQLGKLK